MANSRPDLNILQTNQTNIQTGRYQEKQQTHEEDYYSLGSNKPDVVELPHLIPLVTTQLLFFAYSYTGSFAGILSQNTSQFEFTRQKTERQTFLTKW